MSLEIGFVIVSHNQPQQLRRLVYRLRQVYENPPIAVHHDFSQSPLHLDDFPSDVKFVMPHLKTGWGKFSVVLAALQALNILYQRATPKWFFLLSGIDYPIAPAETVISELNSVDADALIDYREIPLDGSLPNDATPLNPALKYFASPDNLALSWRRYVGMNIGIPTIRKGPRLGRITLYPPVQDWRSPFDQSFKCYFGDFWFAGNPRAASVLLNPTEPHLRLRRYLNRRVSPDECYCATILANAPDLRLSKSTRRFADWQSGGHHPKILELSDLPTILRSKDYFARKVTENSPLLDAIDNTIFKRHA